MYHKPLLTKEEMLRVFEGRLNAKVESIYRLHVYVPPFCASTALCSKFCRDPFATGNVDSFVVFKTLAGAQAVLKAPLKTLTGKWVSHHVIVISFAFQLR